MRGLIYTKAPIQRYIEKLIWDGGGGGVIRAWECEMHKGGERGGTKESSRKDGHASVGASSTYLHPDLNNRNVTSGGGAARTLT